MEYSTLVLNDTVRDIAISDLRHGMIVLVPGVGKRAVRQGDNGNGKPSLVFPKSGKVDAGRFASFAAEQHPARYVGEVAGGWATTTAPKVIVVADGPKAKSTGKLAKGSPEAKARMAKARAARKTSTPAQSETANVQDTLYTLADVATSLGETLRKLGDKL